MAGTGAGYDLSVSTFSPDGRVFQVEYASKAVDNSSLCMAAQCKDGVLFLVEKAKPSPLLLPTVRRIFAVTPHIGIAVAGMPADGRQIVTRARQEAEEYFRVFGVNISGSVLAERVGLFMHAYSLYWSIRPFGASVLIGAVAAKGPASNVSGSSSTSSTEEDMSPRQFDGEVYCVDPSGCCSKYRATALGKGRPSAKTELEKLNLKDLSVEDALPALIKICFTVDDEHQSREGKVEIEAAVLGGQVGAGSFRSISAEQLAQEYAKVKKTLEDLEEEDE